MNWLKSVGVLLLTVIMVLVIEEVVGGITGGEYNMVPGTAYLIFMVGAWSQKRWHWW